MTEDRLIRIENHMIDSAKQSATFVAEQKATNEKLDSIAKIITSHHEKIEKVETGFQEIQTVMKVMKWVAATPTVLMAAVAAFVAYIKGHE